MIVVGCSWFAVVVLIWCSLFVVRCVLSGCRCGSLLMLYGVVVVRRCCFGSLFMFVVYSLLLLVVRRSLLSLFVRCLRLFVVGWLMLLC